MKIENLSMRVMSFLGLVISNPRGLITIFMPIFIVALISELPVSPLMAILKTVMWFSIYAMILLSVAYIIRLDARYGLNSFRIFVWISIVVWSVLFVVATGYAVMTGQLIVIEPFMFSTGFTLFCFSYVIAIWMSQSKVGWSFFYFVLLLFLFIAALVLW